MRTNMDVLTSDKPVSNCKNNVKNYELVDYFGFQLNLFWMRIFIFHV